MHRISEFSLDTSLINPSKSSTSEHLFDPNSLKSFDVVFSKSEFIETFGLKFQAGFQPSKIVLKVNNKNNKNIESFMKASQDFVEFKIGEEIKSVCIEMEKSYDMYGRIVLYGCYF